MDRAGRMPSSPERMAPDGLIEQPSREKPVGVVIFLSKSATDPLRRTHCFAPLGFSVTAKLPKIHLTSGLSCQDGTAFYRRTILLQLLTRFGLTRPMQVGIRAEGFYLKTGIAILRSLGFRRAPLEPVGEFGNDDYGEGARK
jgi:hypothetical protein